MSQSLFTYTEKDQVWVQIRPISTASIRLAGTFPEGKRVYWPGKIRQISPPTPSAPSTSSFAPIRGTSTTTILVSLYYGGDIVVDTAVAASIFPLCWFGFHLGSCSHGGRLQVCSGGAAHHEESICIESKLMHDYYSFHLQPLWYDDAPSTLTLGSKQHHTDVRSFLSQPTKGAAVSGQPPINRERMRRELRVGELRKTPVVHAVGEALAELNKNRARGEAIQSADAAGAGTVGAALLSKEMQRFGKLFMEEHLPHVSGPSVYTANNSSSPHRPSSSSSNPQGDRILRRRGLINKLYIGNKQTLRTRFELDEDNETFYCALNYAFNEMSRSASYFCSAHLTDIMYLNQVLLSQQLHHAVLQARLGSDLNTAPPGVGVGAASSSSSSSALVASSPPPTQIQPVAPAYRPSATQPVLTDQHLRTYLAALSLEDAKAIRAALGETAEVEQVQMPPPPILAPTSRNNAATPQAVAVPAAPRLTREVAAPPQHPPSNFGRQLVPPITPTPTTTAAATTTNNTTLLQKEVEPWESETLRILRHGLFDLALEGSRDRLDPIYLFQDLLGAVTLSSDEVEIDANDGEDPGRLYTNELRVTFKDLPSSLAYRHHSTRSAGYEDNSSRAVSGGRANRRILLVPVSNDYSIGHWPVPVPVNESATLLTDFAFLAPGESCNSSLLAATLDSENSKPQLAPVNWRITAAHEESTTARTMIPLDVDASIRAAAHRSVTANSASRHHRGGGGVAVDMVVTMRNAIADMSNWTGILALIEVDIVPIEQIKEWVISRPMSSYSANANSTVVQSAAAARRGRRGGRARGAKSKRSVAAANSGNDNDDDDDVTVGDTTVQLACPLSGTVMVVPVRGKRCQHLQCVELEYLLISCSNTHVWKCPVCLGPVPYSEIIVDLPLLEFLRTNRPAVEQRLRREGSGGPSAPTATFSCGGSTTSSSRAGYHITVQTPMDFSQSGALFPRRQTSSSASLLAATSTTTPTMAAAPPQVSVKPESFRGSSSRGLVRSLSSHNNNSQPSQSTNIIEIVDCDEDDD